MNFLLINNYLWKPINFTIPINATHILLSVTDNDLRALEHWMPGVSYRPEIFDVIRDLNGGLLITHISEAYLNTHALPFKLSQAIDKTSNVVCVWLATVAENDPEFVDFCNRGPVPPGDNEPVLYELPITLQLIESYIDEEDKCS